MKFILATTKNGGEWHLVAFHYIIMQHDWLMIKNLLLRIREYRNDPNVLLLHYANVRKDLKGSVAKIADFVGVELSPEELDVGT